MRNYRVPQSKESTCKLADKNLEISIIYTPLKSCQDYNVSNINMLKYV